MGNEYILTEDGELYHWGIRGMKWGVRRFQRKDGSLTKAGAKRYAEENKKLKEKEKAIKSQERTKAKIDKLNAKKAELEAREEALKHPSKPKAASDDDNKSAAKKSFKNMSDDELREHINRMNLEKQYLDSQKNLAAATPQKVSKGKKFIDGLINDVVAPAAKNAGRAWLEDTLKDKLGLNKVDPLKKLENEVKKAENEFKKLDWQKKTEKLKNKDDTDDSDSTYEERNKKETYRKSRADYDSGLEDLQRYRKQLESIYGNNAQDKIEKKLKERAREYDIDYGDD